MWFAFVSNVKVGLPVFLACEVSTFIKHVWVFEKKNEACQVRSIIMAESGKFGPARTVDAASTSQGQHSPPRTRASSSHEAPQTTVPQPLAYYFANPEAHRLFLDRQNVRKLVKDGFIIRKPTKIPSRYRARCMKEAKRNGHHSGYGKCKGTREARLSTKVFWMRRMRVLRQKKSQSIFTLLIQFQVNNTHLTKESTSRE